MPLLMSCPLFCWIFFTLVSSFAAVFIGMTTEIAEGTTHNMTCGIP